jgi:predicted nucleotide-binding protein (sugar kinase/HSP70/actin superfamily)
MKTLFETLGADVVVPPKCTRRTMSLATKYSPEGICIPFKLNLGNMIEALEQGADTILNVTGHGTCRMGYYFKVQEEILRDMGYDFRMVLISLSEHKPTSLIEILKQLPNGTSLPKIISACRFGLAKVTALDDIEIIANEVRAVEQGKGSTTLLYREGVKAIQDAADYHSLKKITKEYKQKLRQLETTLATETLKVLIVGEIFVVLDPYANMDVEVELGKLGVVTRRSLYLSRWVKRGLLFNLIGADQWREVHRAAKPYLKRDISGDGWETVGEKILSTGVYDGMIHLAPFTCMPEGIAENIMPSTKEDLPVLAIYCDEQTSKAGMITRLEAFVDMLNMKKRPRKINNFPE